MPFFQDLSLDLVRLMVFMLGLPQQGCLSIISSLLSPQQLPVGTGFSRNADRARTHHRFLHRGDARRHGGSHPRQRFSGRPQEALQEAERVWQRLPQQVTAHFHQTRDNVSDIGRRAHRGEGRREGSASDSRRQSSTFLCD